MDAILKAKTIVSIDSLRNSIARLSEAAQAAPKSANYFLFETEAQSLIAKIQNEIDLAVKLFSPRPDHTEEQTAAVAPTTE